MYKLKQFVLQHIICTSTKNWNIQKKKHSCVNVKDKTDYFDLNVRVKSGSRIVIFKRKIWRRLESLSFHLKWFLFKFITENVCSPKYVERNELNIFFANVRISGNLLLSSCW